MTAFDLYKLYCALKAHFTSKYDIFEYKAKVNVTANSFNRRNDGMFFHYVSQHKDPFAYLLANFVNGKEFWIGDLVKNIETDTIYNNWLKRKRRLTYTFKEEVKKALKENTLKELVEVKDGEHPPLLKQYMGKQISIEILIIMLDICNCLGYWDKKMTDDLLWDEISSLAKNYKPFLRYDREKFKEMLKEIQ